MFQKVKVCLLYTSILYDNCPDFSGFNVRKHGLKTGSLKVRTRITVVRVPAQIGKAVLLCIGFKDTLLIGNGIALALQLVLMGKSWVKGGNWLLVGLCLLYTSRCV